MFGKELTSTRLGLWSVLPKDMPTKNQKDPVHLQSVQNTTIHHISANMYNRLIVMKTHSTLYLRESKQGAKQNIQYSEQNLVNSTCMHVLF